jgi:hypothetical protein
VDRFDVPRQHEVRKVNEMKELTHDERKHRMRLYNDTQTVSVMVEERKRKMQTHFPW